MADTSSKSKVCNGERRIVGGHDVTSNHKFMVYVIKAEESEVIYSGWLCGGSLIKKRVAITSAACVRDVQHMYLIAGYDRYVTDDKRAEDKCISKMKRKIINVCTPKDYNLVYKALDEWAKLDIAVVKADADVAGVKAYEEHCTYIPQRIDINYNNLDLQKAGRDGLILGWGHKKEWRQTKDLTDHNQKILQYGSTKIYNKKKCIKRYADYKIDSLIDKYMICTWPPASFNDQGQDQISGSEEMEKYNSKEGREACSDDEKAKSQDESKSDEDAKKHKVGICQNDHGGPLISWQRSKPKLIGVASVFRVNKNDECEGPFLFTSTYCNSKFLKCVIYEFTKDNRIESGDTKDTNHHPEKQDEEKNDEEKNDEEKNDEEKNDEEKNDEEKNDQEKNDQEKNDEEKNDQEKKEHAKKRYYYSRRSMPYYCKLPPEEKGFEIIERRISWLNHPDGPAETEKYQLRPQRPLQDYLRR